jgi:hypothetical protein
MCQASAAPLGHVKIQRSQRAPASAASSDLLEATSTVKVS